MATKALSAIKTDMSNKISSLLLAWDVAITYF